MGALYCTMETIVMHIPLGFNANISGKVLRDYGLLEREICFSMP